MSDHTYLQPPPDRSVKIPHLVFGLLFLGIAGIWALVASETINEDRLPVLGPAILIGAGAIGLVVSLAGSRNRRGTPTPDQEPLGFDDDTSASHDVTPPTTDHTLVDDEHTKEIR